MSDARFGRLQRAVTLVPLALLSAAWSVSIAGAGSVGSSAAAGPDGTLPDGSTVPEEAIEAPASLSTRAQLAPGVTGDPGDAVGNAAVNGIPSAALAAYQRADTVINAADTTCHLPWQLIAAIGRVESDHGRVNGSHLTSNGLARPAIYGLPLDGTQGTARIDDTDAGLLDGDEQFDRAVGPMQFIPSTWSVVGVDADGDTQRDPQDIDDAALATAVYLCSGDDDLSAEQGQRASVYRYNHSHEYVDLVLSIMQAYMDGDFLSVPTRTTSAGVFAPAPTRPSSPARDKDRGGGGKDAQQGTPVAVPGTGTTSPTGQPTKAPTKTPTPTPTKTPTQQPTQQPSQDPTKLPTKLPTPSTPLPTLPSASATPLDQTLTYVQAVAQCTTQGVVDNPLTATNELADCANALLTP